MSKVRVEFTITGWYEADTDHYPPNWINDPGGYDAQLLKDGQMGLIELIEAATDNPVTTIHTLGESR